MNELEILNEINSNIKKLLGVFATQGMGDEKKIALLKNMGFNSSEISHMTGIPDGTIRGKWKKKKTK